MSLGDSFLEEKISNIRDTLHRLTVHYKPEEGAESPPQSPLLKSSYSADDLNDVRANEEFSHERTVKVNPFQKLESASGHSERDVEFELAEAKQELLRQETRRIAQVQALTDQLTAATAEVTALTQTVTELNHSKTELQRQHESALAALQSQLTNLEMTNLTLESQLNITLSEVKSIEETLSAKESELLTENVKLLAEIDSLQAVVHSQQTELDSVRDSSSSKHRTPLKAVENIEPVKSRRKMSKKCNHCKAVMKALTVKSPRNVLPTIRNLQSNEITLNHHQKLWNNLKELVTQHAHAQAVTPDKLLRWVRRLSEEYVRLKASTKPAVALTTRLQRAFAVSSVDEAFGSICTCLSENEKFLVCLRQVKRFADGLGPEKAVAAIARLLSNI